MNWRQILGAIENNQKRTLKEYIRYKYPDNIYTTPESFIIKNITDELLNCLSFNANNPEYNEIVNRVLQIDTNLTPDDFIFIERLANSFITALVGSKSLNKIPFQKYNINETYNILNKYIDVESVINEALDEYKDTYMSDIEEYNKFKS
jgi:hypothetical protein